jgi:hypothetical protein
MKTHGALGYDVLSWPLNRKPAFLQETRRGSALGRRSWREA